MERRSFLALLASAPIAALAPWSKMLEHQAYLAPAVTGGAVGEAIYGKVYLPIGHPSCSCKHCVLMRQYRTGKMSEMAGFEWYPSSEVAVDMPAEAARLRQALAEAFDRPAVTRQ